jgi:hypothetical protein
MRPPERRRVTPEIHMAVTFLQTSQLGSWARYAAREEAIKDSRAEN